MKLLRNFTSAGASCSRYQGTIDMNELDKFRRVGSAWWKTNSLEGTGPLHSMNPIRMYFIREQIIRSLKAINMPTDLSDLKILDVGCGGGILSESLARIGAKVTGIDPSEENISVAREHSKKDPLTEHINYRVSTIEEIAKSEEKFDVVCSLEVIEHVQYPQLFIDCCSSSLKPGGSLFMSTINRTLKSYLVGIVAAEQVLGMVPAGTHEWKKFITPEELRLMIEGQRCELSVERAAGMVLAPSVPFITSTSNCYNNNRLTSVAGVSLHWVLSDDDLDVNYIMHAIKKLS